MTILFQDGFENGLTPWDFASTPPPVVQSVVGVNSGVNALLVTAAANTSFSQFVAKNITATLKSCHFRTYVLFENLPASWATNYFLPINDTAYGGGVAAFIANAGGTTYFGLSTSTGDYLSPIVVQPNTLYLIEIERTVNNAGTGVANLWVNEVNVVSKTAETFANNAEFFYAGSGYTASATTQTYDDLAISDGSYIGPVSTTPQTYNLTVLTTTGGTTNPAGTFPYNPGTIVQASAIPNIGNQLLYWLLDGVNVGSTNPYTITMDANHTIQAIFTPAANYALALESNITATIIIDGVSYTTPQEVNLAAGPHTIQAVTPIKIAGQNYNFTNWQDGTTAATQTIQISANSIVTATYAPAPKTSKAPLIALTLLGVTAMGAVVIGSQQKKK